MRCVGSVWPVPNDSLLAVPNDILFAVHITCLQELLQPHLDQSSPIQVIYQLTSTYTLASAPELPL